MNLVSDQLFNSVFKDKKILITGHSGFKGSWLTLWLLELGATVLGYSLKPDTSPNLFTELDFSEKIDNRFYDINDFDRLIESIREFEPDYIFHLAAQPLVKKGYNDPMYTYKTNIMGTINVYEAVRSLNLPTIIITITSDKCYENKEWVYSYRENDPMGGYDPYSASKGCVELITASYQKSYFNEGNYKHIKLASVRAGNVIGGGDWSDNRIVPDLVKSINNNEAIILRFPNSTRPWQYVLDALSGYLHLCSQITTYGYQYTEGWNFGPGSTIDVNVKELAESFIKQWDALIDIKIQSDNVFHESNYLKLDISKSNRLLNWVPNYSFNEMMEDTVHWYKNFYSGFNNHQEFSIDQIHKYVKLAKARNIVWSR
ncbi:MAG: CDP-glucose 4,6-dehydratase [Candidatus Heimdallarchaeota archaeon]|nr:CDP-glucose 4,6-dehydratase [Candidatus Heimdallarchaeota archaeon]MDH5646558.1 CDP-glucose 4,6-dehydratase [Candidatus Heimdallarchaeota archaeon]